MAEAYAWVVENWMLIVGSGSTIIAAASAIVKIIAPYTDTKKDDKAATWLDKIYSFLNKVALTPKT
jgi:hypothetical protein